MTKFRLYRLSRIVFFLLYFYGGSTWGQNNTEYDQWYNHWLYKTNQVNIYDNIKRDQTLINIRFISQPLWSESGTKPAEVRDYLKGNLIINNADIPEGFQ